jgi:ferredoxin-NADP reductase
VHLRLGRWTDRDVYAYACGSAAMTTTTRERLLAAGIHPDRVRCEDYNDDPYRPRAASAVTEFEEVPTR